MEISQCRELSPPRASTRERGVRKLRECRAKLMRPEGHVDGYLIWRTLAPMIPLDLSLPRTTSRRIRSRNRLARGRIIHFIHPTVAKFDDCFGDLAHAKNIQHIRPTRSWRLSPVFWSAVEASFQSKKCIEPPPIRKARHSPDFESRRRCACSRPSYHQRQRPRRQ